MGLPIVRWSLWGSAWRSTWRIGRSRLVLWVASLLAILEWLRLTEAGLTIGEGGRLIRCGPYRSSSPRHPASSRQPDRT
jgi:hypothetical protein